MAGMELEGIEDVMKRLEDMGAKGRRVENKALQEAGDVIREAVQNEAPRGATGDLRDSLAVSRVRTQDGAKHVDVGPERGSNRSHIARFIEFGTVKMRANPFMGRGYERSKRAAESVLAEELRRGLGL